MEKNGVCPVCKAQINENAKYCEVCGTKLVREDVINVIRRPKRNIFEVFNGIGKMLIIRNSVILFIAIMLFGFSFAPIAKYSVTIDTYSDTSIDYSVTGIRMLTLLFDSFQDIEEEGMIEHKLYEKIVELTEDYKDAFSDDELSSKERRSLTKAMHYTIRLYMMHENSHFSIANVISLASFGVYFILTLTFLVFALINFLMMLLNKRSLFRICVKLMCLILPLIPVLYYSFNLCGTIMDNTMEKGIGTMVIWSLILAFVGVLYVVCERLLLVRAISKRRFITNGVSLAVALIAICLMFTPIVNSNISLVFSGRTEKKTVSIGFEANDIYSFDMGEESVESLENSLETTNDLIDVLEGQFKKIEYLKVAEVKNGKADYYNKLVVLNSLVGWMGYDKTIMFIFIPILISVSGVCLAFVAWQNMLYLCLGEKRRWLTIISKILAFIEAVASVVCVCAMFLTVNRCFEETEQFYKNYDMSISAGLIAFAVFVAILLIVPSSDKCKIYHYGGYMPIGNEEETLDEGAEEVGEEPIDG